ncbi:hypothetical protein LTR53_003923 [Teratosphaeriaceae sp. CCFEE 6253]|nr:hypothetical protein LTR53_003923 [Teratosphaeriaceae sp. CCFEE 6253]
MATTSGDLSSFGDALDSTGFWGASSVNPSNMQSNCVSVSLAIMEGFATVDELWEYLAWKGQDEMLPFGQVLQLLRRKQIERSYDYKWTRFQSTDDKSAAVAFTERYGKAGLAGPGGPIKSSDQRFMFLYRGADYGHCIVMGKSGGKLSFCDYQHDEAAIEWERIEAAAEIIVVRRSDRGSHPYLPTRR